MTRILALDCAAEFASICLLRKGQAFEALLNSPDGFGHALFPQIDALLRRAGCTVHEIDCFAAASGPGSFTGVRVALSAAKGLAEACGKPIVAVSNLEAMAWHGEGPVRAPFVDARRGAIYGGLFDADLQPLAPEITTPFVLWTPTLPDDAEFVTFDFAPFAPAARPDARVTIAPRGIARAVAEIARTRLRRGLAVDPAGVDANYVRKSDAELNWREPL